MNEMPKVIACMMRGCAYNRQNKCHALAITVGGIGEECPLCDTAFKSPRKGGVMSVVGRVGACKVKECRFNESFECSSAGIRVMLHDRHAECGTFVGR